MKDYKIASVGEIKSAFALFGANPHATIRAGFGDYWGAKEFRRWFRRCLATKINREDNRTGRKLTPDYAANLRHDARLINDSTANRGHHSGLNLLLTPEMKRRYPKIDNRPFGE